MAEVKIGGLWVSSFAHVASATWGTRYGEGPCGPDLATVEIDIDPRNDSEVLHLGRPLEIYDRGVLRFGGPISGISNGVPRTIEAKGWARRDWDSVLDHEPGARIGRDPYGRPVTPTADTEPTWTLDARDLDIGVADDRLYTRVIATYVTARDPNGNDLTDTVTANAGSLSDPGTPQGMFGILPFPLDLTPLGPIDGAMASSYAQQQLLEFAIPEWTSRVVTRSDRLLTTAGHYSHPPDVTAGQMVRIYNMPTSFGGLRRQAATDVILGEVEYSTDSPDEITIAPARVAVRSIADAVRQMAEAAKAMEKAA